MVSGGTSSGDHLRDHRSPSHLPVVRYFEHYRNSLDGRRLFEMHLTGEVCGIHDVRTGRSRDNGFGP